jgi:hypothetical protein
MAFTVQNFRSRLRFGGARPNQFEVIMPFPVAVGNASGDDLTFKCKAASLPSQDMGTIPVGYFGRQIKVPGDRTFAEWSVTIINDEDFKIRDAFEEWSDTLNGHFSNLRDPAARFTNGYQVDATVIQYGKTGDVIKEYDMIGVWPSNISAIDLAWDQNDSIEEFQVTLQYQWWQARTTS